jgi:CubicO group peptidase (beta-lactamase class C family)
LSGWWEASFSDSIHHPRQYLLFSPGPKGWQLTSDEPAEDWYDIPCEKVYFHDDSLYFERFWGLEKYSAKYSSSDSAFHGFKQFSGGKPSIPFIMHRIRSEKLIHRIPKVDAAGKAIQKYHYRIPDLSGGDLKSSSLSGDGLLNSSMPEKGLKQASLAEEGMEQATQTETGIKQASLAEDNRNHPSLTEEGLKCSSLTEVGLDSARIVALIDKILTREIPNIHSLLILKDDQLVLEEYFYGYSPDRLHRIHSVTKSFTSALVGIAIDKGFIPGENEPVWKYFQERDATPWVKDKYDIGIQHLLSMSAGLDWKGLQPGESNDDIDMYKTNDYFGFLLNKDLKYAPGTHFCYNNGLTLMLGHIIEQSSGWPVEAFTNEYLFKPLGIRNYAWDVDENGVTRTDGGLKLRPRDMLKFGLLYLHNGTWKEDQIISGNWIHLSTGQKIGSDNEGYAFHWWIRNYNVNNTLFRTFYALGHGEQAIIIVPEHRLVFVMTAGNYLQSEHRPLEILNEYILPAINLGL